MNSNESSIQTLHPWIFNIGSSSNLEFHWSFESLVQPKVGTIASNKILQVRMERRIQNNTFPHAQGSTYYDHPRGYPNMVQIVKSPLIGTSFWKHAFPRMQIFWQLNPKLLLSSEADGGNVDFIGRSEDHSLIGGGQLGRPRSGVYVKGIWVREPLISGTIMSFSSSMEVNSRDRNDVDQDELIRQVGKVLEGCDLDLLRANLSPLRSGHDKSRTSSSSWLLKDDPPHFLNRVFEQKKKFILHQVLQIPEGSLFVSKGTLQYGGTFIKWASKFLKEHGSPLVILPPNANQILFKEVTYEDVSGRCSELLLKDIKKKKQGVAVADANTLRTSLREIPRFIGSSQIHVLFSPQVKVPFVHSQKMFLSQLDLNREFLLNILIALQRYIRATDSEISITSLQEDFLEPSGLPPSGPFSIQDVRRAVKRAKEIRQKRLDFLSGKSNTKKQKEDSAAESEGKTGLVPPVATVYNTSQESNSTVPGTRSVSNLPSQPQTNSTVESEGRSGLVPPATAASSSQESNSTVPGIRTVPNSAAESKGSTAPATAASSDQDIKINSTSPGTMAKVQMVTNVQKINGAETSAVHNIKGDTAGITSNATSNDRKTHFKPSSDKATLAAYTIQKITSEKGFLR